MNADLVASIILSAGGLTLILVGRSKDRQARRLRQAKSLELDAIPEQLERAGSSYVATAGFVRSAGQARVCDYAINECGEPLTAVLYERQLERLFRQWNAKTLGWDEGRELISVDRIEEFIRHSSSAARSARRRPQLWPLGQSYQSFK